jgi:hypothetical protein
VFSFLATDWDKTRFVPGNDLVVLETKPGLQPDTNIELLIDDKLAQSPRHVRTGVPQSFTIELGPTLFVNGMDCIAECDPEMRNGINFRSGPGLMFGNVKPHVTVIDITDPKNEKSLKVKDVEPEYDYASWNYSLDELGFTLQPGRRYRVRVGSEITATDDQKLRYAFTATIENWNKSAFVSLGSGYGVCGKRQAVGPAVPRAQLPQRAPVARAARHRRPHADDAAPPRQRLQRRTRREVHHAQAHPRHQQDLRDRLRSHSRHQQRQPRRRMGRR